VRVSLGEQENERLLYQRDKLESDLRGMRDEVELLRSTNEQLRDDLKGLPSLHDVNAQLKRTQNENLELK
jgi:hypothetical protein